MSRMPEWKKRLMAQGVGVQDMSVEEMAARRIMKGMGAGFKDIGRLCARFGIPYQEDGSPFRRAVEIFRAVYAGTSLVSLIEAKSGVPRDELVETLGGMTETAITFYRAPEPESPLEAYVSGVCILFGPLGRIIVRPGVHYVACENGIEVWRQDPVELVRSFSSGSERTDFEIIR